MKAFNSLTVEFNHWSITDFLIPISIPNENDIIYLLVHY